MSSPHVHKGTISIGSIAKKPFHAECSCGTAGEFDSKEAASAYLQMHFGKLGGIAETFLLDRTAEPAKGALKTAAQTSGPPPAPPAPPSVKEIKK
jgi:hypothetical protein